MKEAYLAFWRQRWDNGSIDGVGIARGPVGPIQLWWVQRTQLLTGKAGNVFNNPKLPSLDFICQKSSTYPLFSVLILLLLLYLSLFLFHGLQVSIDDWLNLLYN